MYNLLPEFILENYKNNNFEGSFDAITMFMDISGFTSMTEKLMKGEKEGAEILSELLLNIFKPTVKEVYSNNGFISNYAGDSFTSFFLNPKKTPISETAENVLNCGISIINHFRNSGLYKTKYGRFKLTVRIGISFGNNDWAIIGNEFKSFYFRGEGVNGCSEVQSKAEKNEIVFDSKFAKLLNSKLKFKFEKQKYHFKVKDYSSNLIKIDTKEIVNDSPLAKQIFSKKFFPDTVLSASQNGEFRNVASVFISFKSQLSKDLIDKLFNVIIESINHYNGYLKDIDFGDKGGIIVCYFGAPVSNEDDINRAVSFIKSVIFRKSINELPLNLKFGVTYGRVFTGFIGSEERTQYTVVGDKVNLASRFLSKANDNEVWVSNEVFNIIKNKEIFQYSGKYRFKGFTKLIPVYILKFEDNNFHIKEPDLNSKNQVSDLMIGRDDDQRNLNYYVDEILKKNTPGIVNIIGEAGIGKTKLIREFKKNYIQSNDICWLYCYTSEISKFPLSPFKYLLNNFFKQTSSNTNEENKRIFDNILDIIDKHLENKSIENKYIENKAVQIRSELERTRSVLAAMIDIRWENSFFEKLDPSLRLENFQFAFCNLIIAECMIQPVIIEIEDIHWLDKDSTSLINMLINNIPDIQLVIITSTRQSVKLNNLLKNDTVSKLHYNIELKYFHIENIKNLAFKFLNKQIDDIAAQHILDSTNGNPYFAEQLILDYKERNFWKIDNNIYSLIDYDKKILPSTINNILISRFDKLTEDVKIIVQSASVLGREFEESVLIGMFNNSEGIRNQIKIAVEENIWFADSFGKYKFIHGLLQESLYSMQMNSALSELHLRAAESIKKLNYKKLSQNLLEQIAYHLGIGHGIVDHLKKPVFLKSKLKDNRFTNIVNEYIRLQCNIADEYKKEYQNDNALELYDLIENILKKQAYSSEIIEILFKKAEILSVISKWEEAKIIINSAKKYSVILDDKYRIEISNKYMANLLYLQNEYDKSLALYESCRIYFVSNNNSIELLNILNGIGKIYLEKGDYKNSFNVFKEQLKTALKFNADDFIVKAYFNLGNNYRRIGEYKESLNYLKKIYPYFKKISDENFLADLYIEEAIVNFYMGENNQALNKFKKALKVFSKIGNRRGYYRTLGNMGNILIVKNESQKAFELFKQQIKYYKTVNELSGLSVSYFNLGVGLMDIGKFNEAIKYFKLQSDIDKKLKRTDRIANSYSNMAQIYNQTGQYSRALKLHYKQFLIDKRSSNKEGILRATVNIADVYRDSGDTDNALKFYKKGYVLSLKFSIKKDFEYIVKNYSEILSQKGKLKESIKICSDFLSVKKSNKINCSEVFKFIILKNKLLLELNKITEKKIKITDKHSVFFRNLIKNMEALINHFDNKEYTAFAYLDLFELNNLLSDNNIDLNFKNHFNRKSYFLFNELYSKIPQKIYSDKLEELK